MGKNKNSALRENEIRPQEFMEREAQLFDEGIRKLLELKEGFVWVPCPVCDNVNTKKKFEKSGQQFDICQSCQTVFINPRPTPEMLSQYYNDSEYYKYWNDFIFPSSEPNRREKIFKPRAQRLAQIISTLSLQPKVLLEVGAGFGTFCEEAKKLDIFDRIIAIEPTPKLAQTCRNRGIEVLQLPVEKVEFDRTAIDVIASFEVIEHLYSPKDFIDHCARLLQPDGLLVLTCPNVHGFDIEVLQEKSISIDPEHLNYFHPESLSLLLNKHGFEVLECKTPGKLDAELVRKKVLDKEYDLSDQPFLKRILIDEWDELGDKFQRFLAENMMSSHMWIVGIKQENRR
jgi:2-polyprenyl-3-methyl-5-hydroxy-6-metoxy-1,4-benzoquinol methylase